MHTWNNSVHPGVVRLESKSICLACVLAIGQFNDQAPYINAYTSEVNACIGALIDKVQIGGGRY
jgi:hypothetical protein